MTVDFLPERVTIRRAMRARLFRQGYLLGIMLAALVGLGYFNEQRINRAEAEVAVLDSQSSNLSKQVENLFDLQKQRSKLLIKQSINKRLGSRIIARDVLSELGRILPETMSLTNYELATVTEEVTLKPAAGAPAGGRRRGRKAPTKTVKRLKLTIMGLSPNNVDVANFIADLSASDLFEDVDMGYAKEIGFRGRKAKQFQASCYVTR